MQISPELVGFVDELHHDHPRFPRATIERLVLRTAHALGADVGAVAIVAVKDEATAQLTYLDQDKLWGPASANG